MQRVIYYRDSQAPLITGQEAQMESKMRSWHILNLGAGVQSTTLYLMSCQGKIQEFDFAIFADTQEEPEEVYKHLTWLRSVGTIPILTRTVGKLGDHLKVGRNSTGGRFASIPAFTKGPEDVKEGRTRRQCSKEYKIEVIERTIRRDIVGMVPRERFPKDVLIHQYIGISLDEAGRALRMQRRKTKPKWATYHFPLLDLTMTREDCKAWLAKHGKVPHEVPRSACVFCPMHDDAEWLRIKASPVDWARAVEIDTALRIPGNVVNRKMNKQLFVHRSCQPLVQIEFKPETDRQKQRNLNFNRECLGVCGV
jgi:hypothetical protein